MSRRDPSGPSWAGPVALVAAVGWLTVAASRLAAANPEPWRQRPEWWDATTPEVAALTSPPALRERLDAATKAWHAPSTWRVAGPFPALTSRIFDLPFEPEVRPDPATTYPLADGTSLAWTEWAEGQPWPLPTIDKPAVVYLSADLESQAPTRRYLWLLVGRRPLAVWLDGRNVYRNAARLGIYHDQRPEALPLDLAAGRHRLLLKCMTTERVDKWEPAFRIDEQHPVRSVARLRAQLLSLAEPLPPQEQTALAWELMSDWLALDDLPNAFHLATWLMAAGKKAGHERDVLRRVLDCARERGTWDDLDACLTRLLADDVDLERETEAEACRALLEARLNAFRVPAALRFLDEQEPRLATILGGERHRWRLRALCWTGDYARARAELDRIAATEPDAAGQKWYREAAKEIEPLREHVTRVVIDYELETVVAKAAQLARDGSRQDLFRHLREALDARRSAVRETQDPELFDSALGPCREALATYADAYEPMLTAHVAAMGRELRWPPTQCELRQRTWGLRAPAPLPAPAAEPGLALGPPALPASLGPARPAAVLAPSAPELLAMEDRATQALAPTPLGQGCVNGPWAWLQTGRHLAGFRDGARQWDYRLDNSLPQGSWREDNVACRVRPHQPATDGNRVYARLLDRGRFCLVALSAITGQPDWQYRPEETTLCSDAVLWRSTVLLLGRKRGTLCDYCLIALDRESGAVLDELYLFSANDRRPLGGRYREWAEWDEFLPPPALDGDTAFVASHAGVLACVDLAAGAVRWLRRYHTLPFGAADALAKRAFACDLGQPVVGAQTVLFAPVDSLDLILLDKATGRLRARSPVPSWRAVEPLGPDQAALVDADGRRLHVLSLADLRSLSVLPADRQWCLATPVRDGRAAVRDGTLGVLAPDGTFRPRGTLPPDVQPVAVTGDTVLGARPGYGRVEVQAFGPGMAAPTTAAAAAPEPIPQHVLRPRLETVAGLALVVAENYVLAMGDDGRPAWALPVGEAPGEVWAVGDDLALAFRNRLLVVDRRTGDLRRAYPDIGQPWIEITAAAPARDGLVLSLRHDWGGSAVLTWLGPFVRPVGTLRDVEYASCLLDDGRALICHRDGKARRGTLDAAAATYRFGEAQVEGEWARSDPTSDRVAVLRYRSSVALAKDDGFEPVPLRKGDIEWRWERPRLTDSVLTALLFSGYWTVVDLRTATDIAHKLPFAYPPVLAGARLVGLTANVGKQRKERYAAAWYDRDTQTVLGEHELPFSTFGDWVYAGHTSVEFAFRDSTKVYHALRPEFDPARSRERIVVVQDIATTTLEIHRVPGYLRGTVALATADAVTLFVDDTWLRLPRPEFDAWLAGPKPLEEPRDDRFESTVDGFLDEWGEPTDFADCGTTAVAGVLRRDRVCLALHIRDPELIRRLGTARPEDRLRIRLLPACLLGLTGLPPATRVYDGPLNGAGVTGWAVGSTVAPTGDSLVIELSFPWDTTMPTTLETMQDTRSRTALGDLAVVVTLADGNGPAQPLFTAQADRHHAVRLLFSKRRDR